MRLKSTCKPRKGLGLFASLFASQLLFQLSTLSSLVLYFLGLLVSENGIPEVEDNFEEATKAVNTSLDTTKVG